MYAWNSSIDGFDPKTITESLDLDPSTLEINEFGQLTVIGGGSGGSGIAYPLTWSGFSQGEWDGSAPANIVIPSLLSQLTNDSDYITTASVNSLLTDYLPKSGGTISGELIIKAGATNSAVIRFRPDDGAINHWLGVNKKGALWYSNDGWSQQFDILHSGNVADYALPITGGTVNGNISAPQFLASHAIYVNGSVRDCINITTSAAYPAIVMKGANHSGEVRLYNRGGTDWVLSDEGWNNVYPILHSGNYSNYALPITGGTVKGVVDFDKTSGPILTIRDGRYGQSTVISVGYTNQEGDKIKLHIPGAANHDFYLLLSQYAGATLTMGLKVNGNLLATGEVTQHSSLKLKDVVDTRFLTLKELVALKPYSFRWRDGRDDKLHVGAVADYVMPILPEVISTDKDNIHSMNYANAAWVVGTSLTPYVSKHEEDIDWLKARVRYLEDKLKEC